MTHLAPSPADTLDRIASFRVVPIVVTDDPAAAGGLADALVAGGLPLAEVTLRTSAGLDTIEVMARRGDVLVGAGTVLTAADVDRAADAGAAFVVSPGLSVDVVARSRERGLTVVPGVTTATEVQSALALGLTALKLFPVVAAGGLDLIGALNGPFPLVRLMPSGGITRDTAAGYLAHPSVFAIGASWMTPRRLLAARDFASIEALVAQTVRELR